MGLLDDLKQQADSLRQQQQVTQRDFSQNLLLSHAKLKDAREYWTELFNSLNVIKPVILRQYYLEGGATTLENLRQQDYTVNSRQITIDQKDYLEAIVLGMLCASDQKLTIEKQTDPLVKRMREHLWANNVKFDLKEIRNERNYVERGIFTVICMVPVTITIAADLENAQIKITAKNLEKFGEYTYFYDFDEFGKEILEELGKTILAKPNSFRTMGKRQEAMRITTSSPRAARPGPDYPVAPQPAQAPRDQASDPTKSFIGNIKSLLKR